MWFLRNAWLIAPAALREHESVPLELTVEGARGTRSTIRLEATVRAAGAASHRHAH